jgi:hypothetical protein
MDIGCKLINYLILKLFPSVVISFIFAMMIATREHGIFDHAVLNCVNFGMIFTTVYSIQLTLGYILG